jgi:hypothetical protein
MNPLSQISPATDAEVAHLVRADTLAALGDDIARVATAPFADGSSEPRGLASSRGSRPRRLRKRLLIGVPAAAAVAVVGLIATSAGAPGQHVGPVSFGPPKAQAAALSFTRDGRFIDVIVRNPVADPKRYRAEFAKYHLNIGLTLVPASPSIVGTLVAESLSAGAGQLTPITAVGKCYTGGGGNVCPVGVKVPIDYRGTATLVFGRPARPGEQFESAGEATAPGEAMHGLHFEGRTVAAVLAMLAKRGVTVPQWRVQRSGQCYTDSRRTVPSNWLVYQAVPWAPGQVLLWAAKTLPLPACAPTVVASPAPTPSTH